MLISLYSARASQATLAVNIVTSSNGFVQKKITGFAGWAEVWKLRGSGKGENFFEKLSKRLRRSSTVEFCKQKDFFNNVF